MKASNHEKYIQQTFDSFCKKVLKNEATNYHIEMKRRRDKEALFSEMAIPELEALFSLDEYPVEHTIFNVVGYDIEIKDELLAGALLALPEQKRDIILLYHFVGMMDKEIADLMQMVRQTVQRQRIGTIKLLREIMEEKEDE